MTYFVRKLSASAAAVFATSLVSACGPDRQTDGGMDVVDARDATVDANTCPLRGVDEQSTGTSLVLGTGRDGSLEGFRALAPGDVLWVVPGEQGLQHLLVALRGSGFDPRLPLVQVQAFRASDCASVGSVRFRLPFQADAVDPATLELPTFRVTLVDDNDRFEYCTILDRDVDLMADMDDGHGNTAHRELRIHVGGIDPNARPDQRDAWIAACAAQDGGAGDVR